MHQFSNKTNNFEFLGPNLPRNWFWGRNFKNVILDSESTPPLYHVCQFSVRTDNIGFFDLILGRLPNYVQYFGSNIVEGVSESWLEVDGAGWRWVHSFLIPFDDIFRNLSLVVSYTKVILHSQCYIDHHCARDIPATRFHLMPFLEVEILVGRGWGVRGCIPPLLPISHICPRITPVHKLFAQLCCLGLQLHWR